MIFIFLGFQEEQNNGRAANFQPNVIMQGHSPSDYVLNVVSSIRPNDLEQALLVHLSMDFLIVLGPIFDTNSVKNSVCISDT